MKFFNPLFTITIIALLALTSCASNKTNRFTLTLSSNDIEQVTLINLTSDSLGKIEPNKTDLEKIIFEKDIFYPNIYSLQIGKEEQFFIVAFPNDNIHFNKITNNNWSISGSVDTRNLQSLFQDLNIAKENLNDLKNQFLQGMDVANIDSLRNNLRLQSDSITNSFKEKLANYIEENSDSFSCLIALRMKFDDNKKIFSSEKDFYLFELVDQKLFMKYPEVHFVREFHKEVEKVAFQLHLKKTNKNLLENGTRITNLSLPDSSGKIKNLSFYNNKYTYLQFLKSDINTNFLNSTAENQEYINKVQLINIWIENDFKDWKEFIKNKNYFGLQLCDTAKHDSTLHKRAGVVAVPTGILLNKYGRIISSHLRLENVLDTIKKIEKP